MYECPNCQGILRVIERDERGDPLVWDCVHCHEIFCFDDDDDEDLPDERATYDGWPMYLDAGMDVEDATR